MQRPQKLPARDSQNASGHSGQLKSVASMGTNGLAAHVTQIKCHCLPGCLSVCLCVFLRFVVNSACGSTISKCSAAQRIPWWMSPQSRWQVFHSGDGLRWDRHPPKRFLHVRSSNPSGFLGFLFLASLSLSPCYCQTLIMNDQSTHKQPFAFSKTANLLTCLG